MSESIEKVRDLLSSKGKIVITTHRSPDGDAIGSSLALYHYLVKKGHSVKVITPNDYPDFLHWLPGDDGVLEYHDGNAEADEWIQEAELVFCLDFNSLKRLEGAREAVEKCSGKKILIDHHPDPTDFADVAFSDAKASSTAQIVYEFIDELGDVDLVDKTISDCLYVGIMTDTGSFRFSSTRPKTHKIAAELLERGVDGAEIQERIFDNNSLERMRLLGYVLSNKLMVKPDHHTAYISLTMDELSRFQAKKGDTEGFVNNALALKGVRFAAFFTEIEDGVKMSFRSKGDFPANEVAKRHFRGGGHLNAAGGISNDTMEKTIERFLDALEEFKPLLDQ